jgi:hypothetical protein
VDELKAYRVKQAAERPALGVGRDPSSLVFARIDGDPIQPDSVTKMFARIAERARSGRSASTDCDIPTRRISRARRASEDSFGTPCHASIAITMDTYSHAIPGLQGDAAQRIDAALRSALPKN